MYAPTTMTFVPSRRGVTCGRCLEAIDPDAIAVASVRGRAPRETAALLHPDCAIDVDTKVFCELLRKDPRPFEARADVEALAFVRERAIEQRALAQWRERHMPTGDVVASAPSRPLEDDPTLVRPAHDRRGRPRVRVMILGTAVHDDNATSAAFWSLLREGYSWPSAKREYVFVARTGWRVAPDEDPAQPIIGFVYAPLAKKSSKLEKGVLLWLLSALGFSPPLLWLHGIKAWKLRDENVLRIREHVERAQFDADLCPTICTPIVDAAAMDALVLALDEHFDGAERRVTGQQSLTIARALLRVVRDGHTTLDERAFDSMLSYVLWGRTADSEAVVAELVALLLAQKNLSFAGRALATRIVSNASLCEQWLGLERERGHEERSPWISTVFEVYAPREGAAPFERALELATRSTHPSRHDELMRLLDQYANESSIEVARAALARIESPTLKATIERLMVGWATRFGREGR